MLLENMVAGLQDKGAYLKMEIGDINLIILPDIELVCDGEGEGEPQKGLGYLNTTVKNTGADEQGLSGLQLKNILLDLKFAGALQYNMKLADRVIMAVDPPVVSQTF